MQTFQDIQIVNQIQERNNLIERLWMVALGIWLLSFPTVHEAFYSEAYDVYIIRLILAIAWGVGVLLSFSRRWIVLPKEVYQLPPILLYVTIGFYMYLTYKNLFALDYLICLLVSFLVLPNWPRTVPFSLPVMFVVYFFIITGANIERVEVFAPSTFMLAIGGLMFLRRRYQSQRANMHEGLMTHTNYIYIITDEEGQILYLNTKEIRFGLEELEANDELNIFDLLHKDDIVYIKSFTRKILDGELNSFSRSLRLRDYRLHWQKVHAQVFKISGLSVRPRIAWVARFVSEAEEAAKGLFQKSQELGDFVEKTASTLQAPLSSIKGMREIVNKEVTEFKALRLFSMIFTNVRQVSDTLQQNLELSRLNRREVKRRWIDFPSLVDEIVASLRSMPQKQNTQIRTDIPREVSFMSDPMIVRAILRNLIINATQYKANKSDKHTVTIRLTVAKTKYVIQVIDTGIGIPEEALESIFEMFYRGDVRSTGSGLGLYIVKTAVTKLKGEVFVEETSNEGTTISVLIPMFDE